MRESITKRIPNRKHRLFIDNYFKCNLNATKAYMATYPDSSYDTANANGTRLLVNASVREEVDYRLSKSAMSADETLARLADVARGDLGDFDDLVNGKTTLADHPKSHLVHEIIKETTYNKQGEPTEKIKIKLYNARQTLVDIGRAHNLFSDSITIKLEQELTKAYQELKDKVDPETFAKVMRAIADDSSQ